MSNMLTEKGHKWRDLGVFLSERLKSPFGQPEFIFYFLFIVILVGGNGIWYTWWSESRNCAFSHEAIIISLVSYAVALTSSGSLDLILSKIKSNRNSIIMIGITLLITSLLCFILAVVTKNICFGYFLGGFSVFVSLVTWWIANAVRPELNESDDDDPKESLIPLGGPVSPKEAGQGEQNISGNLSGLKA